MTVRLMAKWFGIVLIGLAMGMMVFALMSCNQQPGAADGYAFSKAEYRRLSQPITFVEHRSLADLRFEARGAGAPDDGRELMAWSELRNGGCTVHILDPVVRYYPEWIGHEITHCIYGRWHP